MIEFGRRYLYKEVCEILGEERLSGSKLQTQVKRWNKKYKIERDGRYYVFEKEWTKEEVAENELRGFYSKRIEAILSDCLASQSGYSTVFSTMELLIELGMVSEDYKYCKYNDTIAAEIMGRDKAEISYYMSVSYEILSRTLKRVLKSLKEKRLIDLDICYKTFNYNKGSLTDIQEIEIGSKDHSLMLKIQNLALKDLDCKDEKEVFQKGKVMDYYDRANYYCKMIMDKDGFFTCNKITMFKAGLRENAREIREELNEKTKNKLENSIELLRGIEKEDLKVIIESINSLERPLKIKEKVIEKKFSTHESVEEI